MRALSSAVLPLVLALGTAAAACGDGDDGGSTVPPDLSVEAAGPHAVGVRSVELADAARARSLPALILYPAQAPAAPEAGLAIEQVEDPPRSTTYAGLLDAAPAGCPTRRLDASLDATPEAGPFPLVVVSHCHECTRFSTATLAIRLASHGFVVAAVDHTGNTLWDQLAGGGLPLDGTTLDLRVGDLRFAIGELVRAGAPVPAALQAAIDPTRIGVLGHSFGAVTAGEVAQDDARVAAGFALAAPMENPLLPGVTVAGITKPLGFLLATEDNSITELGNQLIRNNYDGAGGAAYKLEVKDAGHWSVSDLLGVVPGFMAGCGDGTRQTDGQPFTYVAPATARDLASAYVTAFFAATLEDDAGARAYLTHPRTDGTAIVSGRPAPGAPDEGDPSP
ncbi:MAG TPA: hypothetical protein VHE35_12040 [Kofleriaceae bacterium]|nr:hypothetical protein [Kofleriaceae bacterium]